MAKPRTVVERKLTPAEQAALFALLDDADVLRLDGLIPMIANEPAWWLQKEVRERAAQIQTKRAAEGRRGA
jgi:hypothetical protein